MFYVVKSLTSIFKYSVYLISVCVYIHYIQYIYTYSIYITNAVFEESDTTYCWMPVLKGFVNPSGADPAIWELVHKRLSLEGKTNVGQEWEEEGLYCLCHVLAADTWGSQLTLLTHTTRPLHECCGRDGNARPAYLRDDGKIDQYSFWIRFPVCLLKC